MQELSLFEIFLSVEAMVITGVLAYLVLNQRLTAFSSVRNLFFLAYATFALVVGSELGLYFIDNTVNASMLMRIELTSILVLSILLGLAATIISLKAKQRLTPYVDMSIYREMFRRPSFLFSLGSGTIALFLIWFVFSFDFTIGEKIISGKPVLFPQFKLAELGIFSLVLVGMVWNQTSVLSKDIVSAYPESVSKIIRKTGILWMAMAVILFVFNGVLRVYDLNLVEYGHLLNNLVLGYLAIQYTKPTGLMDFFATNYQMPSKVTTESKSVMSSAFLGPDAPHKRILFKVDSVSNYTEQLLYFLDSSSGPSMAVTYEGSSLSESVGQSVKTIELSLSGDRISVAGENRLKAGMTSKNVYEILKWAIDSNPKGRLIIDGLSHFILLLGHDEVYSFVTFASELCHKQNTQLLFVVNKQAHNSDMLSGLEGISDYVVEVDKNKAKTVKPDQNTVLVP